MAFGTNFHTDIGFGGADFDLIAACAPYAGYLVIRMNSVLHDNFNPLKIIYSLCCSARIGIRLLFAGVSIYGPARRSAGKIRPASPIQRKSPYVNRDIAFTSVIVKFFAELFSRLN
jgi:hypothetical protein